MPASRRYNRLIDTETQPDTETHIHTHTETLGELRAARCDALAGLA